MGDVKEQPSADHDGGQAGDRQGPRDPRLQPARGPRRRGPDADPVAAGTVRARDRLTGSAGTSADGAAADLMSVGASTAINGVVTI